LLACIVCISPAQSFGKNVGPLAVIAVLLAAPVWIGRWNPMLMSDMHAGTVLAALGALVLYARVASSGIRSPAGRLYAIVAALLVILTVSSDPFSVVFAFGPAALVFSFDWLSGGRQRNVVLALALLVASVIAGLMLPSAMARIGGFTTENDVALGFALPSQWLGNSIAVVTGTLTLLGANPLDVNNWRSAINFVIRCITLAIPVAALVMVIRNWFCSVQAPLLDRMLCAGIVVLFAACVTSAQFAKGVRVETVWHGGPPTRFLVPAVLFAAVLSGRQIGGVLNFVRDAKRRLIIRGVLVLFAGITLAVGAWQSFSNVTRPNWIDDNPAISAARWLERHGLSQGVGEYWSANLLTAMSRNAVTVRSVVPAENRLVPYVWVEDRDFYGLPPQFAIWQEPNQTGMTEALVRATFRVCRLENVAGYRIALLSHDSRSMGC
jgi:hypothetical protein